MVSASARKRSKGIVGTPQRFRNAQLPPEKAPTRHAIQETDASQQLFAEIFHDFFTPDFVLFVN